MVAFYSWYCCLTTFYSRNLHEKLLVLIFRIKLWSLMKLIVCWFSSNEVYITVFTTDLISTLLSLSTVRLPFSTLTVSLEQVSGYLARFHSRLLPVHVIHLKRLITFISAIKPYASQWEEQAQQSAKLQQVLTAAELMHQLGRQVEGINFHDIVNYLQRSKVFFHFSVWKQWILLKLMNRLFRWLPITPSILRKIC